MCAFLQLCLPASWNWISLSGSRASLFGHSSAPNVRGDRKTAPVSCFKFFKRNGVSEVRAWNRVLVFVNSRKVAHDRALGPCLFFYLNEDFSRGLSILTRLSLRWVLEHDPLWLTGSSSWPLSGSSSFPTSPTTRSQHGKTVSVNRYYVFNNAIELCDVVTDDPEDNHDYMHPASPMEACNS